MVYVFLLLALAGLLVGGVISLWQQKTPRWIPVALAVLALMSLIGAALFAWG